MSETATTAEGQVSDVGSCGHVEHTTGFTGKPLGRYGDLQPWEPCSWTPHCEHWVGYGDEGSPECCICPGNPCGAVTVEKALEHRVYDEACAERHGVFLARVMISDAIAAAAPADRPLDPADAAHDAAVEAFHTAWVIARGKVDEPPF